MNETRQLTEYLAGLKYDDLPKHIVQTAKFVIRDMLGVGLFASRLPWSRMVADFGHEISGSGNATVWGREWKTTAPFAALANGTAAHGIEMDERIHGLPLHNGSATVASALAVAEEAGCNGQDLILAVVCSYELAARVSRAAQGNATRYIFSPGNILGSATAAGKLLGLDHRALLNAVGIAGGTSCGITEYASDPYGTMVKRLQGGGWPAHFGVTAAMLAQKGFTGPSTILEGQKGVLRWFRTEGEPDVQALVHDLGEGFQISLWETKWYAAWGGSHSSIEAVGNLQSEYVFEPDEVDRVLVGICSRILPNTQKGAPESILAAQHNLPFIIGAAFYYDLHDPSIWQESILADARILTVTNRIEFYVDDELDRMELETHDLGGSKVALHLQGGRHFDTTVWRTKGTLGYPLTPAELESKFRMMSGAALPQPQVDHLAALLGEIEDLSSPVNLSMAMGKG